MASGFWLASGGFASLAFTPDKKERSWTGSSAARTGVKKQGLGTQIVPVVGTVTTQNHCPYCVNRCAINCRPHCTGMAVDQRRLGGLRGPCPTVV